MLLAAAGVKELTETTVLFLLTSSPAAPNPFGHQGLVLWKTVFSRPRGAGDGLRMIQTHHIHGAFTVHFISVISVLISSTSDHQALDPGGW